MSIIGEKYKTTIKILCFIVVMSLMVALTACQGKKPITGAVFKETVEAMGYVTFDSTDASIQFTYMNIIKSIGFETDNILMEFLEFGSNDSAVAFFDHHKARIELDKGKNTSESSVNKNTYQKYTLKTQQKYYLIECVGATAIYVSCDILETEKVDGIIKEFGY